MSKLVRISIITVVFNDKLGLENTIQSVLSQSYKNIEYIIIDGGSTDGTLDIIKKYEDRIDYWVSEKDKGIYDAMNKGIDVASGEWINFMNAGDGFYSNDILEKLFSSNNIKEDIVFGKSISYYKKDEVLRYENFETEKLNWYYSKTPNHQSIFIRKKIYKNIKYDLCYKYYADTVYLREVFNKSSYYESNQIINKFELGGKSNYYGDFKTYKFIVKDSINLHQKKLKPFLSHTLKFILQKVLGKDMYMKFYIRYMVKR